MSKLQKWFKCMFWGVFWAAVPMGAVWLLVRYSGELAALAGNAIAPDAELSAQIAGSLEQLKAAKLVLPWLWLPVAGLSFGTILKFTSRRPGVRRAVVVLGILLFVPVVLLVLWMTEINGILAGKLFASFLPMLKGVL